MKEVWEDIKGYEGLYQISNLGRVKSMAKEWVFGNGGICSHGEMIMKSHPCLKGYLHIGFRKDKKTKHFLVHRIVAETFIENKNSYPEVNHKDGNKLNNCISNLEWVTSSENAIHAVNNGLRKAPHGERQNNSKLKEREVIEIYKSSHLGNMTSSEIANRFNIDRHTVNHIRKGKTWSWLTKNIAV